MDVYLVRWVTRERRDVNTYPNIYGEKDMKIMESGVAYFDKIDKKHK